MHIFLVLIRKEEYNSKVKTKGRQENFVYGKGKRNQNQCNAYFR